MELWQLAIFGLAGFSVSIFSGIAGMGGGFIMTPLAIVFGLPPAQAVSTAKFGGLATAIGSLVGMRESKRRPPLKILIPVLILSFAIGLVVPLAIKTFNSGNYRVVMGVLLLLMIPVVIKRPVHKPRRPTLRRKVVAGGLLSVALFLQGAFSGGLDALVNATLMGTLGMKPTEANIVKRWSQAVLNATIIVGVMGAGLIVWQVATVGMVATFLGSSIGGRLAVNWGDRVIANVMVVMIVLAAAALISGV